MEEILEPQESKMQRSRRTNPYPFTWELPVAVGVAVLLVAVLAAQVGRSVANAVVGNGWVFVDRPAVFTSLGGVLAGDAAAGLSRVGHPAGPAVLWGAVGVVEVVVVFGVVLLGRWGWGRWSPSRMQGMATASKAEDLLGVTRLRRHAAVIRPDLYGGDARRHHPQDDLADEDSQDGVMLRKSS